MGQAVHRALGYYCEQEQLIPAYPDFRTSWGGDAFDLDTKLS